jgi:hypothetical protein
MDNDDILGQIREDLRGVSRKVFGKQYRLEVAAAASAIDPPIWSRRLSKLLDIAENQVAMEIVSFAELGALQRFPAEHDRRKIYQAVPHPLWPFARQLLERAILSVNPEDGEVKLTKFWASLLDGSQPTALPRKH